MFVKYIKKFIGILFIWDISIMCYKYSTYSILRLLLLSSLKIVIGTSE